MFLKILRDGVLVLEKQLPGMNLQAGRDTTISIRQYLPDYVPGCEYLGSLHVVLKEDKPWAEKGYEVASDQLSLTGLPVISPENRQFPEIVMLENNTSIVVETNVGKITIDKQNGALDSYIYDGREMMARPLLPDFSRPLTDNDRRGWKPQVIMKEWYNPGLKLDRISTKQAGPGILLIISSYSAINGKARIKVEYLINGDGTVKVHYSFAVTDSLPDIPKVGMQCGISGEYDEVTWYGRGKQENYIDRRSGSFAGIYSLPLKDLNEPYVYPQETGNRTDIRWMFLSGKQKEGLLIVADSLLSMSAWPYTEVNINLARHTNELMDAGFITLNIDLVQMGIGGNDSWSYISRPAEKYLVPAKAYQYSFYLVPGRIKVTTIPDLSKKIKF